MKNLLLASMLVALTHSAIAAPTEGERFQRLNGGLQYLKANESQMRWPMVIGGIGVGTTLLTLTFVDPRFGTSILSGAIGGGLLGLGIAAAIWGGNGPIQHLENEMNESASTSGKLKFLETKLREVADQARLGRKVGFWVNTVLAPVAIGLSVDQYVRGAGGAGGWLIAGVAFTTMAISNLVSESPFERLEADYKLWAGEGSRAAVLNLKPNLSIASLAGAPAPSLGLTLSWGGR